jgi:hypothetical protein
MMTRHPDGTVDHDGEYNPWESLDKDLHARCVATGGGVFRTGTVILGRSTSRIEGDKLVSKSQPSRHIGDGLHYYSFGSN